MTPEAIIQFVEELYAATGAGDFDRAAEMLTDDFVVIEAPCLPMGGIYHGRYALRDLFLRVVDMADVAGFDFVQITAGGDHAVTILSMRFADPSLAPAELCEMFRFRDGKCCEIKPYYFDPGAFIAAVEAKRANA